LIKYRILDIFFVVFHTSLILFNISGWIWKRARIYNLAVLILTGCSWFILGLAVGALGYCPLTDWHFSVLGKLGVEDLPNSYLKYLTDRITGLNINSRLIDGTTLYAYFLALIFSLFLNVRDSIKSKGYPGRAKD
jgi:hypothetical protein